MTSENNSLLLNLQEVDKTTGEVVKLDVNSTSTVQPVALMRLGLFVPTLKSTGKSKANRKNVTDATEELVQLSIAKSEGYTDVKITGSRLDMDTDFKVWLGIIRSMSDIQIIMHSEYMEVYNERFRSQMIRCNSSLFIMIYWKLVKFYMIMRYWDY